MITRLVIIGAGGFGRETLDVIDAVNGAERSPLFEVAGVIDDNPSEKSLERLWARGVTWLGTINEWLATEREAQYLLAIGSPPVKRFLNERFVSHGLTPATAVHPSAGRGAMSWIGPGSVVCAGAQISSGVSIGSHVHINPNATIGHDTDLGDFASVNPAAVVSGDVTIGPEVLVGAGAVIMQGVVVGPGATIGASACVVRNVAAGMTVKGVPAR